MLSDSEIKLLKLNQLPRKIELKRSWVSLYILLLLSPFLILYSVMIYQGISRGYFQTTIFSFVVSFVLVILSRPFRYRKSQDFLREGHFVLGVIVDSEFAGWKWYSRFSFNYRMIVEYDYFGKKVRVDGAIVSSKPKVGTLVPLLVIKGDHKDIRFPLIERCPARLILPTGF